MKPKTIVKSDKPMTKCLDQKRVRPTDITLQIPDSSKFRKHFNWKPKRKLDDICNDLLKYWRSSI